MALHVISTNTVFIHFPKTGGTFIREMLNRRSQTVRVKSDYHTSHTPMNELDMSKYDNSFAFVRDPITWYESTFKFMLDYCVNRGGKFGENENNPLKKLSQFANISFQNYMDKVIDNCPGHYQSEFFKFVDLEKITYIGRQETLNYDLHSIFNKIGLKHNRSSIFDAPEFGKRLHNCEWKKGSKEQILKANQRIITTFYKL